MFLKIEKKS